jgi:hypothetical protein
MQHWQETRRKLLEVTAASAAATAAYRSADAQYHEINVASMSASTSVSTTEETKETEENTPDPQQNNLLGEDNDLSWTLLKKKTDAAILSVKASVALAPTAISAVIDAANRYLNRNVQSSRKLLQETPLEHGEKGQTVESTVTAASASAAAAIALAAKLNREKLLAVKATKSAELVTAKTKERAAYSSWESALSEVKEYLIAHKLETPSAVEAAARKWSSITDAQMTNATSTSAQYAMAEQKVHFNVLKQEMLQREANADHQLVTLKEEQLHTALHQVDLESSAKRTMEGLLRQLEAQLDQAAKQSATHLAQLKEAQTLEVELKEAERNSVVLNGTDFTNASDVSNAKYAKAVAKVKEQILKEGKIAKRLGMAEAMLHMRSATMSYLKRVAPNVSSAASVAHMNTMETLKAKQFADSAIEIEEGELQSGLQEVGISTSGLEVVTKSISFEHAMKTVGTYTQMLSHKDALQHEYSRVSTQRKVYFKLLQNTKTQYLQCVTNATATASAAGALDASVTGLQAKRDTLMSELAAQEHLLKIRQRAIAAAVNGTTVAEQQIIKALESEHTTEAAAVISNAETATAEQNKATVTATHSEFSSVDAASVKIDKQLATEARETLESSREDASKAQAVVDAARQNLTRLEHVMNEAQTSTMVVRNEAELKEGAITQTLSNKISTHQLKTAIEEHLGQLENQTEAAAQRAEAEATALKAKARVPVTVEVYAQGVMQDQINTRNWRTLFETSTASVLTGLSSPNKVRVQDVATEKGAQCMQQIRAKVCIRVSLLLMTQNKNAADATVKEVKSYFSGHTHSRLARALKLKFDEMGHSIQPSIVVKRVQIPPPTSS